jgi:polysaccharide export outer membrane protein
MLSRKETFRRLRRFGFLVVIAGLAGCSLQAQSDIKPQPVFDTASSTPAAPVGTTFSGEAGNINALAGPDNRVAQRVDSNYRIGADDVLTVNVWHEPEVSRNVPVRPDGKISLPLVGDVQASGLTPTELQNELEARFAKFLTNPDVSVIVAEIRSQRINVLGQVLRPGTYPLIPPMSVIDAVATAGGLKEFAKPGKIYILRTLANGQRERIKFKYNDVLKGKRGSEDVLLQTRDTVVVP